MISLVAGTFKFGSEKFEMRKFLTERCGLVDSLILRVCVNDKDLESFECLPLKAFQKKG